MLGAPRPTGIATGIAIGIATVGRGGRCSIGLPRALAILVNAVLPLLSLLPLVVASCGPAGEDSRALLELERLGFLPAGGITLSVVGASQTVEQQFLGTEVPLLVDTYEVTRGDWQRFLDSGAVTVAPVLAEEVRSWTPETVTWPASFMTLSEAEDYAAAHGMRLLTAAEWAYCAMGPNGWPYPWGTTWQESVANTLELRLERPTPVGTFESGRTPLGCYDMLGNVAEWVSDAPPSGERVPGDGRGAAMGGSFRRHTHTIDRPLYEPRERRFLATNLPPGSRADHIGVRCCVDARAYLWEHAAGWGDGEAVRERLVAVGRRWGRRSLPVLQELAARPAAPAGLAALVEGARE